MSHRHLVGGKLVFEVPCWETTGNALTVDEWFSRGGTVYKPQRVKLTYTAAENSMVYSAVIGGTAVNFTSDPSGTDNEIKIGLVTALRALGTVDVMIGTGTREIYITPRDKRTSVTCTRKTVVSTAWSVTSNVLTITVASGHGIVAGNLISFDTVTAGGDLSPAAAVTSVTATTVVVPLTAANGSATEAGTITVENTTLTETQAASTVSSIDQLGSEVSGFLDVVNMAAAGLFGAASDLAYSVPLAANKRYRLVGICAGSSDSVALGNPYAAEVTSSNTDWWVLVGNASPTRVDITTDDFGCVSVRHTGGVGVGGWLAWSNLRIYQLT